MNQKKTVLANSTQSAGARKIKLLALAFAAATSLCAANITIVNPDFELAGPSTPLTAGIYSYNTTTQPYGWTVAQQNLEFVRVGYKSWTAESEDIFDGCSLVRTGAVELLIWSATAWQSEYKAIETMAPEILPAIVGIAIAIERARPLQALLGANNVSYALGEGGRVIVAPEQAGGLMIEFMPQN